MGEGGSAAAIDRLPWLQDEPRHRKRARRPAWWVWSLALLLPVAAAAYWFGTASVDRGTPASAPQSLPLPPPAAPLPQAKPSPEPSVATPESTLSATRLAPTPVRKGRVQTRRPSTAAVASQIEIDKPEVVEKPKEKPLQYWPATTSAGAAGRMVRIGAFSSRAQAKRGWGKVVKIFPGMKRIPTAVVPVPSMRDGRIYYRLQMGTTSQAHSEVLCQRMRAIGQSCVVVGLIELK